MKQLFLFSIASLIFIACKKNKEITEPVIPEPSSYETMQHPSWAMETLKRNYKIQFPPGYTGGYLQHFEGSFFDKRNVNDSAMYSYYYSTGLFSPEFRDTLTNLQATSLIIILRGPLPQFQPIPTLLNKRVDFTTNGELTGILFYNELSAANARLYLKHNGYFRESLDVSFRYSDFARMITIIRTIRRI